ncbi:MAG: hypothetical protein J6J01_10225 [Oscillospiraceae bacterium]|nr:hypothetical protein [Clostridia bacterium]MBP3699836.1 hypothetical protein [Oscillospiraceae bacterium]
MNETKTMYHAVPVVSELNRVKGFDPTRFLRKTKEGPKLDLSVKKLWFRMKYPNGRIKLSALKITDQLAIIEARVYFDKNDTNHVSSFTAQTYKDTTPGGLYVEMAQHNAVDEALSSAGFGIQFAPANESRRPLVSEDEVPKTVAKPVEETPTAKVEAPTERKVEPAPEIVPQVAEPTVTETIAEEPIAEQLAVPVEEVAEAPVEETPAAPIAEVVETAPVEEAPAEVSPAPSVEVSAPTENVTEIREDEESGLPYNKSMSVEEICALMTEDEARNYVVPVGTCKNWTMDQVASRRPISLKYYLSPAYNGDDNILRAAATILLNIINSNAA